MTVRTLVWVDDGTPAPRLRMRTEGRPPHGQAAICPTCSADFVTGRRWRFCSDACEAQWRRVQRAARARSVAGERFYVFSTPTGPEIARVHVWRGA